MSAIVAAQSFFLLQPTNKMVLTKDRNGDFVPSTVTFQKKATQDNRPEGLYDAPWGDVDSVISGILKAKMEKSVTKSAGKNSVGKQALPLNRTDVPTKNNIRRFQAQHSRQTSLPDQR